ncbi:FAD/NAD(P)-binding protein [Sinomicrobium soli]|uniref:FAD/NAD(P)-binding protein n=1 Tax=Sinomicrobium sp. N-1-3-6 TaxID=2219864 RepID=UPI001374E4AC|nr:FAD/NAD(P)-binding protein [Sinomicrobium sp. N-1-3-6]
MIWTRAHIGCGNREERCWQSFYARHSRLPDPGSFRHIAVVGGGPKGLYALERAVSALKDGSGKCCIHWFNSDNFFACGPNFRTTQPEFLLINFCIGHIRCHTRALPVSVIPSFPDLVEWIAAKTTSEERPAAEDFASRALVGTYLRDYLYCLFDHLPEHIEICMVAREITAMEPLPGGRIAFPPLPGYVYRSVLLCTGHCYDNSTSFPDEITEKPGFLYFRSPYPVALLDAIPAGDAVAVLGMGLSFTDVALALTEGRGGRFHGRDTLTYSPSGSEPLLYPFSRSNLPMIPRMGIYHKTYRLFYLSQEWADRLKKKKPLDFTSDILPVLQKEICFAYYSTLLGSREENAVSEYMDKLPGAQRFGWKQLLFPAAQWQKEYSSYGAFIIDYMAHTIAEAEKGECHSPLMAAAAVWRIATPLVAQLYEFCGFTGESHREFLKNWYGPLSRVSFGPPVVNMKKVLALIRSGTIRLPGEPPAQLRVDQEQVMLSVPDGLQTVTALIDARIARAALEKGNNRLYANLNDKGLVTPLVNDTFRVGAITLDRNGRVITASGSVLQVYAYGTPTEGTVLDNDSLSREKHNFGALWARTLKENCYEKT